MSIINECKYCLSEVNERRTYRKQTEIYDAIGIDVQMCWNCGEVALFERERIIELLNEVSMQYPQPSEESEVLSKLKRLIKGETNE